MWSSFSLISHADSIYIIERGMVRLGTARCTVEGNKSSPDNIGSLATLSSEEEVHWGNPFQYWVLFLYMIDMVWISNWKGCWALYHFREMYGDQWWWVTVAASINWHSFYMMLDSPLSISPKFSQSPMSYCFASSFKIFTNSLRQAVFHVCSIPWTWHQIVQI